MCLGLELECFYGQAQGRKIFVQNMLYHFGSSVACIDERLICFTIQMYGTWTTSQLCKGDGTQNYLCSTSDCSAPKFTSTHCCKLLLQSLLKFVNCWITLIICQESEAVRDVMLEPPVSLHRSYIITCYLMQATMLHYTDQPLNS